MHSFTFTCTLGQDELIVFKEANVCNSCASRTQQAACLEANLQPGTYALRVGVDKVMDLTLKYYVEPLVETVRVNNLISVCDGVYNIEVPPMEVIR